MKTCRICDGPLGSADYSSAGPSMTSTNVTLPTLTQVFVCDRCGHAQSPELPDVRRFYDTEYRISLASEEHDQLVTLGDGRNVFRTDFQAEAALSMAAPPQGAQVLDYGAAKASTLRKIMSTRPDITPYVFDVSQDYRGHWNGWIAPGHQAIYRLPDGWEQTFDLITAHFVLEHVADPLGMLRTVAGLLKPEGKLFLSVPDALGNPGDLMVIDHLNHFVAGSLRTAFARAGLEVLELDAATFAGALIVAARRAPDPRPPIRDVDAIERTRAAAAGWARSTERIHAAAARHRGSPAAIYGAGFYGSWIATLLGDNPDLRCFLDRNPHAQDDIHIGLPVLAPDAAPDEIEVVYAGLNPLKARAILASVPTLTDRTIIWLDD
jgi:SAM-dependent methyltransferase